MQKRLFHLYGGSILDKYTVKLMLRAYQDLDEIYLYIAETFMARATANEMIDSLEKAILGLDIMPCRGAERKIGAYANKGYRQLIIKNFTIIYRIVQESKEVIIVTVRYTPSEF